MASRSEKASASLVPRFWLPVAAYVGLITVVSHQPNLHPPISYVWFLEADKVAHVIEYSILGLLLARAWRATISGSSPLARGLIAVGCGIALGAIDEYHQSFVRGRDSSVWDLVADAVGIALAQLAYFARVKG
jgi:VanZ family protein